MSVTDASLPPTTAPPADPVRAALDDPAVYARLLRHAAAAYRGSKSSVEDIVQTACVRALDRSGRYDPAKGSITSWVGGFIGFVCQEQYRKEGREPRHRPDFDLAESTPAPPPEDAVAGWREVFDACIGRLSREDRDILDMAYVKDWKHERIATHYGITNAAVRKRASRAMDRVKQLAKSVHGGGQS